MANTNSRVVMIVENSYPQINGGGAESQLTTLSSELIKRGSSVTIIAQMKPDHQQAIDEDLNGVHVHRIKYPAIRIVGGIYMLIMLMGYLLRHRNKFDVIHVHIASNMAALSSIVGKLLNKPVLVKLTGWTEIHNGILDKQPSLRTRVLKWAIKKASHYQATSQQIASLLEARGFYKKKINLIPNAVDIDRFNTSTTPPHDIPSAAIKDKIGIFVGRLVKEKNIELFLTVFSKVFIDDDDISLLIVGDGYLMESLKHQSVNLGISNKVFFLGSKTNVEDYMNVATFGILPSLYEGLSNTLLEYMASGLPVVGSRVSGTEDIITNGYNGWLFESSDEFSLIESLTDLKNMNVDDISLLGSNAREFITNYASIDQVTDRITEIYNSSVRA